MLGILHIFALGFGDGLPAAPQTDHVDAVGEGFHVVGRRGSRGAPVSEPAEDDFVVAVLIVAQICIVLIRLGVGLDNLQFFGIGLTREQQGACQCDTS